MLMEEAKWTASEFIQLLREVEELDQHWLQDKYEVKADYLNRKINEW